MVNKANVLRVADAIEKGELVKRGIGFNMAAWNNDAEIHGLRDLSGHRCGTVACIGGHAAILFPEGHPNETLGLSLSEGKELFYAWSYREWYDVKLRNITIRHAVAVLRHLAETGEVDWSVKPQPQD